LTHEEQAKQLKQYLIIRVEKDARGAVQEWTPLPGLFTESVAEQVIAKAQTADPEGKFLMQEVGRA
jgi:hypothetical protein